MKLKTNNTRALFDSVAKLKKSLSEDVFGSTYQKHTYPLTQRFFF